MITVLNYSSMPFEYELFETNATKEEVFDMLLNCAWQNFNNENLTALDDFQKRHLYKVILSSTTDDVTLNPNKVNCDMKVDFDDLLTFCSDYWDLRERNL